jgi:hypothetical protein
MLETEHFEYFLTIMIENWCDYNKCFSRKVDFVKERSWVKPAFVPYI